MQLKEEVLSDRAARYSRYRVGRRHAAPVEHILCTYSDATTDLYDVLRVTASSDDALIKRAYRSLALAVHPGRSGHRPQLLPPMDAACSTLSALLPSLFQIRILIRMPRLRSKRCRRPSTRCPLAAVGSSTTSSGRVWRGSGG